MLPERAPGLMRHSKVTAFLQSAEMKLCKREINAALLAMVEGHVLA